MKKYDREKKKWVSAEEYERTHQPHDKQFCHGKTPHDFILVLPERVSFNEKYKHNPEEYYDLLNTINDFNDELDKKIEEMGVVERCKRGGKLDGIKRRYYSTRLYICSVCKKKHYEYKE